MSLCHTSKLVTQENMNKIIKQIKTLTLTRARNGLTEEIREFRRQEHRMYEVFFDNFLGCRAIIPELVKAVAIAMKKKIVGLQNNTVIKR